MMTGGDQASDTNGHDKIIYFYDEVSSFFRVVLCVCLLFLLPVCFQGFKRYVMFFLLLRFQGL